MKFIADIPVELMTLYAAYTDLKRTEIDNWVCAIIAVYAAIIRIRNPSLLLENVFCALAVFLFLFGIYAVFKGSMGGGDVKLLSSLAVFYGADIVPLIFLACITATIYGFASGLVKRNGLKASIKFGPFIFLAAFMVSLGS